MYRKLFYAFIMFISCNRNGNHITISHPSWDMIQIITRTQVITIENSLDSAKFVYMLAKDASTEGSIKSDSVKTGTKYFHLEKEEKDSLYSYIANAITHPTFTDRNATEYAGYVKLKLSDRNTTLTCEYKSVGEWSTVSHTTEKIYLLLKQKIPIAYQ
jgi:hypothetical protein